MPKYLEAKLSKRATEYFGGDVQRFYIERDDAAHCDYMCEGKIRRIYRYRLYQVPHWLPARERTAVDAYSAREARREFNSLARYSDRKHA